MSIILITWARPIVLDRGLKRGCGDESRLGVEEVVVLELCQYFQHEVFRESMTYSVYCLIVQSLSQVDGVVDCGVVEIVVGLKLSQWI